MQKIIDIFKEISKIPHCSYHNEKLKDYILSKAKEFNYKSKSDKAGNILVYKDNPKLALQAHYDMVCVGDAPNIEIIEENNILKAKNSSLGADNGIAIAIMIYLMSQNKNLEFLFTNNEEVGLIGAKELALPLKSKYILNLDSEDESLVFIGCAGGVDIKATKYLEEISTSNDFYQLSIENLPGGHSGVDIDKNIPNAIIELSKILKELNAKISIIKGGVATNAIPANAVAIASIDTIIKSFNNLKVKKLKNSYKAYDSSFLNDIISFKNGVISFNNEFNVVENSSNIGLINLENSLLTIDISLRSLSNENLEKISLKTKNFWESRGYKVEFFDKYPAWKPKLNNFSKIVKEKLEDIFGKSEYRVIHAGLECGILQDIYPDIQIASIGPNIKYPHSLNEQVEIDSLFKTFKAIELIINEL